jgi:hypothetical protein
VRFNPPPNWPRPPEGWTPPAGWAPDPTWGQDPAGWQYWLPDEPAAPSSAPPPAPPSAPAAPPGMPPGGTGAAGFDEAPGPPPLPGFVLDPPTGQPTESLAGYPTERFGAGTETLAAGLPPAGRRTRGLRRPMVLVPGAVVLVAALTGGGLYGNQAWQEHQAKVRLEQAHQRLKDSYAAGHASFLTGDCKAADPKLTAVADPVLEPDLTEKAKAEQAACAKLEFTRGAAGDAAAKLVAYLDYINSGPGAPLQPVATQEAVALFTGTPADKLASGELCDRLDAVGEVVLTSDAARSKSLPGLLLRCADRALKDGDPDVAQDRYQQVRDDYGKAPEAARATTALAKLIVADGKKGAHTTVTPPPASRRDSGLGGNARLVIYNGTPQELQLTMSGPSGSIGNASACTTCKVFATASAARCAFKGSHVTLTVPAGKYAVDLRFPDEPARPAIGSWTVRAGTVYEACFYVAKR